MSCLAPFPALLGAAFMSAALSGVVAGSGGSFTLPLRSLVVNVYIPVNDYWFPIDNIDIRIPSAQFDHMHSSQTQTNQKGCDLQALVSN